MVPVGGIVEAAGTSQGRCRPGLPSRKNCASRSGKTSNKAVPVISKSGRSDLRYALCQAALIASSQNNSFIKYFYAKLHGREKERGIKLKMRVKLAAKMLVIAWTLMKNQEPFNPAHLQID